MHSLVGYGVSSESDSDGDGEDVNTGAGKERSEEAPAAQRTRNFLLEPGSASSESDSGSEPEGEDPEPSSSPPPHPQTPAGAGACLPPCRPPCLGALTPNKLPPPTLNTCSDSGVFANPFKAQADQRLSALQKHVPLTMQAKPSQIGGKRVCVSYRKDGRCRFGIKCKFAHDSDLQTPAAPADCPPPPAEDEAGGSAQEPRQESKEEESGGQQGKRRRVGLSNTLVPPKRAMKQFAMQRDRERINMS